MKYLSPSEQANFQAIVWDVVRQIPEGKVATYGQIARMIPVLKGMDPKDYAAWSARWVGGAMAACPQDVPWQRVINSQGKISLHPGSGAGKQRMMLEAEGVPFDQRDRVDLRQFAWNGPSQEWLREHGFEATGGSGDVTK